MLGLFQTSDEFEVLVEDDEKENPSLLCTLRRTHGNRSVEGCLLETLGETLGPRFDLVSDLVLVQLEKTTYHKFALNLPQKENRSFQSHPLCFARKNEQPESRVSWGSQTNNRVEAVAQHTQITHQSFGYLVL